MTIQKRREARQPASREGGAIAASESWSSGGSKLIGRLELVGTVEEDGGVSWSAAVDPQPRTLGAVVRTGWLSLAVDR